MHRDRKCDYRRTSDVGRWTRVEEQEATASCEYTFGPVGFDKQPTA